MHGGDGHIRRLAAGSGLPLRAAKAGGMFADGRHIAHHGWPGIAFEGHVGAGLMGLHALVAVAIERFCEQQRVESAAGAVGSVRGMVRWPFIPGQY